MSLEMNSEHPIIRASHPIIAPNPSSQLMLLARGATQLLLLDGTETCSSSNVDQV